MEAGGGSPAPPRDDVGRRSVRGTKVQAAGAVALVEVEGGGVQGRLDQRCVRGPQAVNEGLGQGRCPCCTRATVGYEIHVCGRDVAVHVSCMRVGERSG